jgi:hypothetical protein
MRAGVTDMPTDQTAALAALGKRLDDAKEFL